jgi:hypothetical protein
MWSSRGVALYFVAEFELSKARWYWLDEQSPDGDLPPVLPTP